MPVEFFFERHFTYVAQIVADVEHNILKSEGNLVLFSCIGKSASQMRSVQFDLILTINQNLSFSTFLIYIKNQGSILAWRYTSMPNIS